MPLTPQDVQNKLFTKTFRGYDMEEVDGFLDEVEAELGRLLRENNDLRTDGPGPAAPMLQKQPAPQVAMSAGADSAEVQQAALRVLGMAEQTLSSARLEAAEQLGSARTEAAALLESARNEADATLTSARTEAERLRCSAQEELDRTLTPARAEASQLVASAREEAEKTLTPARAEAERLVAEAQEKAEATLGPARAEAQKTLETARAQAAQHEAQSRGQAERALAEATAEAERLSAQSRSAHQQAEAELAAKMAGATRGLETRRTSLESHIEDLRSFEREYRSRLKAYLLGQLGDLEGRVVPEDGGAGVPSQGRTPAGEEAGTDLDLSDDAPDMEADAGRDVPLGERQAQPGAQGVGPFRSGPEQSSS